MHFFPKMKEVDFRNIEKEISSKEIMS